MGLAACAATSQSEGTDCPWCGWRPLLRYPDRRAPAHQQLRDRIVIHDTDDRTTAVRDLGLVAVTALVPLIIAMLWRQTRQHSRAVPVTRPTTYRPKPPRPDVGYHDLESGIQRLQTVAQIAARLQAEQPIPAATHRRRTTGCGQPIGSPRTARHRGHGLGRVRAVGPGGRGDRI